ncbi:hypothetical protein H3M12_00875 [Levilactobacillus suantsaii]|uniref:hypothetical protein n=2 Tax=Levilactobacillus suantsaii TaxID=2292255 RepID=UPI0015F3AFAB|nr:hypothetical protein [Levilactobacillus suantsaii]QMU08266.1 hypothetical protein H3M12_00875 [Levilactobacillus suantsaii]
MRKLWQGVLLLVVSVTVILIGPPVTGEAKTWKVSTLNADSAKITDVDGHVMSHTAELPANQTYHLNYIWRLYPLLKISVGDTMPVTIPTNVRAYRTMSFPMTNTGYFGGNVIGSFYMPAGAYVGTVTFNQTMADTNFFRKGYIHLIVRGATPVAGETEPGIDEEDEPETTTPEQFPEVTDPEIPDATEPEEPGTTEPENPGTTEPENPGTTEPENPGTITPENPGTTEPENPGTTTPENPGITGPETPGTTEPETPGTTPTVPEGQHPTTPPALGGSNDNPVGGTTPSVTVPEITPVTPGQIPTTGGSNVTVPGTTPSNQPGQTPGTQPATSPAEQPAQQPAANAGGAAGTSSSTTAGTQAATANSSTAMQPATGAKTAPVYTVGRHGQQVSRLPQTSDHAWVVAIVSGAVLLGLLGGLDLRRHLA